MTRFGTLGLCAAIGVACVLGGTDVPSARAETVRMWTFLSPNGTSPREQVLGEIIDAFEAGNPDIDVVVEKQVWNKMTPKFLAAHQAGTAPDIIWAHTELLNVAIQLMSLENLRDHFMKDWTAADVQDIDDGYYRHASTDEATYCITHSRNYMGVIYRKDMLADAGIDPQRLDTWPAFLKAAEALTMRGSDGTVERWGFGQAYSIDKANPQIVFNIMLDRQGAVFDKDGRAMWATDAGVDGLRLQLDMVRKYKVTADSAASFTVDDLYDQFAAGRYAIIQGAAVRVPRMQKAVGADKVGFMAWPGEKPGTHSPSALTGWCVGVWSRSQVKEAAARFVEFMSSPASDTKWALEAGAIPVRKSTVADNPDYFARADKDYLARAAEAMVNYGWLPPLEHEIGGWREDLNRAAQDALVGGMSEREALEKAQAEFNRRNNR